VTGVWLTGGTLSQPCSVTPHEALDNGRLAWAGPARLPALCDGLSAGKIEALLRKWLRRLPHPSSLQDCWTGYAYRLPIRQGEFSPTQVPNRAATGRIFFEEAGSQAARTGQDRARRAPRVGGRKKTVEFPFAGVEGGEARPTAGVAGRSWGSGMQRPAHRVHAIPPDAGATPARAIVPEPRIGPGTYGGPLTQWFRRPRTRAGQPGPGPAGDERAAGQGHGISTTAPVVFQIWPGPCTSNA